MAADATQHQQLFAASDAYGEGHATL